MSRRSVGSGKRLAGIILVLTGIFLIFLCMPMQFFLILLGLVLAAAGFAILK